MGAAILTVSHDLAIIMWHVCDVTHTTGVRVGCQVTVLKLWIILIKFLFCVISEFKIREIKLQKKYKLFYDIAY